MPAQTRRVESRYETCPKRLDGEFVVCDVVVVVQDVETGYITLESAELRVPSALGFTDAIAEFERQRQALDAQENK